MTLLTAEDVLNKKFQPTKFREGYDQDEVDDFLDDVVGTLRALTTENEQLRANLAAAQSRISELESDGGGRSGAPSEAVDETEAAGPAPTVEAADRDEVTAEAAAPPAVDEPEQESEQEQAPPATTVASLPSAHDGGPQSAAGMLALAQRVHDEYVANGQAESERLVKEARTTADRLVTEAEEQRTKTLGRLEQERVDLEQKIDELRAFERDYRERLKTYLEGLLQDIEGADAGAPATRTIG